MKLSICILTCDKDCQYLSDCIDSVMKSVKFDDFEIVIVDNRIDKTSDLSVKESDKIKIIKNTEDTTTFFGRKLAFENSTGDYIYYVDCDDVLINEITEDLIPYGMKMVKVKALFKSTEDDSGKVYSFESLWSYFIHRDVLELVYSKIDKKITLCTNEDSIMVRLCKIVTKKVEITNHCIYQYNNYRSGYNSVDPEIEKKAREILVRATLRLKTWVVEHGTI